MSAGALSGRCALVTGSSTGIGRAIAEGMREAGAEVVFHSLEERPSDLPASAPNLQVDLSEMGAPEGLIEEAFRLRPKLDILVSNAGSYFDLPFLEMTLDRWGSTINLNLRAAYFLVRAFARRLVSEGRTGSVVVVSSTNAFQAELASSAYDISKGGLVSLVRAAALELAGHGIRVNGIAPGLIRTPLTEGWMRKDLALVRHYERTIPMKRIGDPRDCAGAAVFLASEAAAYITGQTLIIDGGLSVQQIGELPG
ncbi:MAG: 2-dehydro-3-deoxy-D-gluconate 5-dehydrogenase [bacterium]|nr:2-dehydro-3-deoxy-D-gluconate 5-dehydrogenase [bacterium]